MMPWKEKTVEEIREEFVLEATDVNNFSLLCREFGISRVTGYKWLRRYQANEALSNKSCTPNVIANKTPKAIEEKIVEVRTNHPGWGAKKIKYYLENKGTDKRIYRDTVEKYEYGGQYHVIKGNSWGYVRFANWQIYLSETMANEYIEFRPNPHGDTFIACYRNFAIAEFDVHTGKLIHRKIQRL